MTRNWSGIESDAVGGRVLPEYQHANWKTKKAKKLHVIFHSNSFQAWPKGDFPPKKTEVSG